MWSILKGLVKQTAPVTSAPSADVSSGMPTAAARCVQWTGSDDVKQVSLRLARLQSPGGLPPDAEPLLSDAAAWLGESVRRAHGGSWLDHPLWGLVLQHVGGINGLRLLPLAVVEKQVELGTRFDLARFLDALPRRIESERQAIYQDGSLPVDWPGFQNSTDTAAAALGLAEGFRCEWKSRLKAELPFTLIGVRELDGWLRSHYLINRLEEPTLVGAGFFLGEVARGLFGGTWHFQNAPEPHDAALRFPELDYFPVGRIYRQMLEHQEGKPLDEYVRLVPSARRELAKSPPLPKDSP